jgi:hypothetical protein
MRTSDANLISIDDNVTISGALVVGTTNVLNALDLKAPLANPALTGTATAVNLTVSGELVVAGNNMVDMLNPYWVAVVIGFSGGNPYFIRNGGRYAATALTRMSGQATGVVQFDFPAHPQGINYLHHFGGLSCFGAAVALNKSNTRLGVVIRSDSTIATVDREVHVFIPVY